MLEIDTHLLKRSMTGPEDECGDTGVIRTYDDQCFLGLVDVLGHGREAHEVAVVAERYLEENHFLDLAEMMKGLHACLKGTRGAVAGLCRLNRTNGETEFVGTGNITVKLYGMSPVSFVSRDGVIGYKMGTPKKQRVQLQYGDILILTSDGVKANFDPVFYPGLLTGSARKIAGDIMDQLGKNGDDASCIVLRYGR
jgi:negative regulator of sigma-B (phosphoserine phosphatase)